MPAKNNRNSKESSDKKSSANTTPRIASTEKLSGEKKYEGYDEKRNSSNPLHESDYNVDEKDVNKRSDKDFNDQYRNKQ
jgi:hypothetical protein